VRIRFLNRIRGSFFRWQICWLAHWVAVAGVVLPVVIEVFWT
jgi:hypothetical protein